MTERIELRNRDTALSMSEVPEVVMKKSKSLAVLSYLNFLALAPLFMSRQDETVKRHLKQGVFLLLCLIFLPYVLIIPLLGWIIGAVWAVLMVVIWMMGVISAITGREKSLPIIGKVTDRLII